MKYKLRDIIWVDGNAIFLAEFKSQYDLAMTFLRYQEYYESANAKFRGKQFTIIDFMEWYAREHDGVFSYPGDWSGFNVPDWVINDVSMRIPDFNKYDLEMHKIVSYINTKLASKRKTYASSQAGKFYLIGAVEGDSDVIEHEMAHGLYYISESYRKEMDALVKIMPEKEKAEMFAFLKKLGYAKKVWKDETQAYLSTGEYDWKITEKFAEVLDRHRPRRKILSHPDEDPIVMAKVMEAIRS